MSTTCLDDPRIQTFSATSSLPLGSNAPHNQLDTALEIKAHEYSPIIIDGPSILISESQYDLHGIPTYLSERTRRPSSLIRKNSDLSILKDTIHLQTLSADGTSILNNLPGDSIEAKPERSEDTLSAISYPPASNLTPRLSKLQQRNSMVQFLALCWCIFLVGWNDGSTGPLLPRIQENYRVCANLLLYRISRILIIIPHQIGFSVVSLIFVGNCAVSIHPNFNHNLYACYWLVTVSFRRVF